MPSLRFASHKLPGVLATAFLEVHDARHGRFQRLCVLKLWADISLHLESFDPAVVAKKRLSALQGTVSGPEVYCFAWP